MTVGRNFLLKNMISSTDVLTSAASAIDCAIATDTVDALARQSVTMVLCGESCDMRDSECADRRKNGHGKCEEVRMDMIGAWT